MIYILFIGLCILVTPQNALLDEKLQIKEANNESDDDKLNQALILVDILKTGMRYGYESSISKLCMLLDG